MVLELQRQQLAALMSQHLLKHLDSVLRESDGGGAGQLFVGAIGLVEVVIGSR